MDKAIEKFLNILCVEWGFCLSPSSVNELKESEYFEASEFAEAVLKAEGMNPETEIEWKRKIKNKFVEVFGQELNKNEFNNAL